MNRIRGKAPVAGATDTAQDAQRVVDRLYEILRARVSVQHRKLYVELPIANGKTKRYPLYPRVQKEDDVKDWVMSQYRKLYPSDIKPQVQFYQEARTRVKLETELAENAQDEPETEDDGRTRDRRGRCSQQYAAIIQSVEALQDFIVPAREVGVRYARVPYTLNDPGLTGIWRLDPERPYRLLDCAISFTDISRPHAASKSADYSGTLIAQNAEGERKEIQFTRDELEDKGLDAKLVAFADWPHVPTHKYWLLEALKHLMRAKDVALHDQYNALGYAEHPELGLVWIANNGIETETGFIPSEQAPFIGPSLLSPGNGYRALPEPPAISELNEEIWSLLLGDLNPDNWARMYGKLGATARLYFPEGTVERAGKLDFVLETVGEGSGQGKSAEDCYILSEYGADFVYDRPPLINDDTAPSRPHTMEAMRYCAFMVEDRKAREGNPQFIKQHETRKKLIEQYADNTGGGMKMTAYGRRMVSRGNPQGLPLLTGNADHSAYGLRAEAGEEEATEWRACTFLLSPGERADYEVSKQINARRSELTAWGVYLRRWIMQQYNADRQAFMLRVQSWRALAEERVRAICPEWPHTRPMNACIDMVWGMLARQAFLQDMFPETYRDGWLWNWIQTFTEPFIENRLERARYLQSCIDNREQGADLGEWVLDTLRVALGTAQYHIASQQEKLLQPDDVPLSLTKFGMRQDQTLDGNELWRPSQHGAIGYYLARKDGIAFNPHLLYAVLEAAAQKQKYPLPSKQDFKRKFAETGVPSVKRDEYGEIERPDTSEWVNGKSGQYITISLRDLYPVAENEEATDEERELQDFADEKVTPIRRTEPATVSVGSSRAAMNGTPESAVPVAVADRPSKTCEGSAFCISEEDIEELEDL